MADDQINQDEIEALLKQAQGGAAEPPAPKAPDPPPPAGDISLDQSEIERLISQAPTSEAPPQKFTPPAAAGSPPSTTSMASDVEVLLSKAEEAIASIDQPAGELPAGMKPFALDDLGGTPASTEAATLELVRDVQLDLKIELGRTHMHLEDVLRLKSGAVVPLDKLAGDPVDVLVNGRLIARGEVLVLNDNFCVRVTELVVGDSAVA
ncbi:Flagellar motor switch protein FliN [Posidoniimonas polymericola]|uniref:Flagellar motor switch protein FliN n=1 Tax=Posidoniimonas polymericola TaxID=2528002 RepID=A0A5C5YQU8_9BACT|nr:flagellar motor switch protein FliN [Posidoniimonas polymericola]TWT77229.1 Flagellar motor switch protein FliN [Posidoniimonas polymericola]